jgi:hypothetical protein
MLLVFCMAALISALASPSNVHVLPGTDVKALSTAYREARLDLESMSATDFDNALARVSETGGVVRVSFERGSHAHGASTQVASSALTVPLSDAKAISLAYDAWASGKLENPFPRSDVLSGNFRIQEWRSFSKRFSRIVYVISYTPLTQPPSQSGVHCAAFHNYEVVPGGSGWRVLSVPKIC